MPGFFSLTDKQAFDKEIENDAFVGRPTITLICIVEENNIVIAEELFRLQEKMAGF
jgi:hypothetical protein